MDFSHLKKKLEHAFKIVDGRAGVTEEDQALLEKIAKFLIKKRMTVPAFMFLETMKPLNFVGSSMMTFFRPTLGTLLSRFDYERLEKILERRCGIALLLEKIEELEKEIQLKNKKKENI